MQTLLDNKKKKLFDEAYQAYLKITKQIEDVYSEGIADPFADSPSVTDMICSLDQYLQGCLFKDRCIGRRAVGRRTVFSDVPPG